MELLLQRQFALADALIGTLHRDGVFECYTLEALPRPGSASAGAIPAGRYPICLAQGERKARLAALRKLSPLIPRLQGVPGRAGILISIGNGAGACEGNILVGQWAPILRNRIADSAATYAALHARLRAARGAIGLTILDRAGLVTEPPQPKPWPGLGTNCQEPALPA